jgi:hypothetical protein
LYVDVAFNDIEADLKTLSLRGRRRKALDRDVLEEGYSATDDCG